MSIEIQSESKTVASSNKGYLMEILKLGKKESVVEDTMKNNRLVEQKKPFDHH